jgi:hypothetical protein
MVSRSRLASHCSRVSLSGASIFTFNTGAIGGRFSSPAINCAGLPHPRSSNAVAADTRAEGGAARSVQISTSVPIATLVCAFAAVSTARSALLRPPGLPEIPFEKGRPRGRFLPLKPRSSELIDFPAARPCS